MKTLLKTLFPLILLLQTGLALSEKQATKLEVYLQTADNFSAKFTQKVFNSTEDLIEESSGHMSFARPGKFRWVYQQPYEQEIISDGKTLWVYDKDLEQVSIRTVNEDLNKTPIMLLDDPASIGLEFNIELLSDTGSEAVFHLTPKHEEVGFQSVTLIFSDNMLAGMTIYDSFDQTSHLTFHHIQHSRQLADTVFHFDPPEGVDVIRASEQPH